MTRYVTAWLWLLALAAASTALALATDAGALAEGTAKSASAAILTLAWLKARVILSDYLGLRAAPRIRRGFDLVLALFMALLLALYLAA
ncbi:MAG: cytochrome C oxidase subunit IV family protein [Paracoccus sp. (in: a-proteobacteria)]|nr:cytochrome C oxidase subunit IV family protein [Paracoccus sp. (in: a-proteobacteria)]